MSKGSFDLARLRAGLKPLRLHWFPRLRSTNDHAALLRRRGELFAPAVVLTGHQTAGRGRGSNTWWSGRGSITVTFVLPIDDQVAPHQLPLIAGLAVRNAVARLADDDRIQLKWPNDLLCEGRKLAGLLCERIHRADLVGLGLNVSFDAADEGRMHPDLRGRIISLSEIAARPLDLTDALLTVSSYLRRLLDQHRQHPFASLLQEYDRHHALLGKRIRVIGAAGEPPVEGTCRGLDGMGRLLVQHRGRTSHVIAGHVVVQ